MNDNRQNHDMNRGGGGLPFCKPGMNNNTSWNGFPLFDTSASGIP